MEQFLGLIVVLVVWGVISYFGKAAKKQQAAAKMAMQQKNASPQPKQTYSTSSEIEKLIEMFAGNQSPITPVAVNSETQIGSESHYEEETVESTGYIPLEMAYKPMVEFQAFENSGDSFSEGGNIVSDLHNHEGNEKMLIKTENRVHPLMKEFDPKKAVIYSEILQPKYF
ncbi:MAG: hypothetical protein CVU11_09130 [Bacteroidetes bacterium HGW-Bacteroidetes-6]|jgi:hypothetical protein|nr:MAG: hypothetical protein CVU11_09130 [Bacteroidetes bacterium HGW-Bacteroidetes-6]